MKDFNIWLSINEESILFIIILILLIAIFFKLIIIFYSFRLKFIKKCGLMLNYSIFIYLIFNIEKENDEINNDKLYDNVWNIDKMLYSFWIWDYKKMVYDKNIIKQILCDIPEDIKFKIKGVVEDEIILNSQLFWFMLRDEIIKKKYENIF